MKKLLMTVFVFALALFSVRSVSAYTHASVKFISATTDSITVELSAPNNWLSCFEYRTDGDTSQRIGNNYNPIYDDLYPFWCLKNQTVQKTISADEYAEIRMVFGAEGDERFDWTRFDVLFNRTAEITSPGLDGVVSGIVSFDATLNDKDKNDSVQWAVRKGTCVANTNTVFGNVDGFHNDYDWDHTNFHALADTSLWEDGKYCFVFNPSESTGDTAIREIREFTVNNTPDNKDQCKKDGWKSFFTPEFKNQGDCVSYIQSNKHAISNKEK